MDMILLVFYTSRREERKKKRGGAFKAHRGGIKNQMSVY